LRARRQQVQAIETGSAAMKRVFVLSLASMLAAMLIGGCADQSTRPTAATSTSRTIHGQGASAQTGHRAGRAQAGSTGAVATPSEKLPAQTGIAACDEYLASYKACHRAAGIYAPGQLDYRYRMMRTSLLRDSLDPDTRPQLAARCNSLALSLRDALHGKSCAIEPAHAGTAGE
jgi:hypothetical protein